MQHQAAGHPLYAENQCRTGAGHERALYSTTQLCVWIPDCIVPLLLSCGLAGRVEYEPQTRICRQTPHSGVILCVSSLQCTCMQKMSPSLSSLSSVLVCFCPPCPASEEEAIQGWPRTGLIHMSVSRLSKWEGASGTVLKDFLSMGWGVPSTVAVCSTGVGLKWRDVRGSLPLHNLVSDSANPHYVLDPRPQPLWDHRSTGQL